MVMNFESECGDCGVSASPRNTIGNHSGAIGSRPTPLLGGGGGGKGRHGWGSSLAHGKMNGAGVSGGFGWGWGGGWCGGGRGVVRGWGGGLGGGWFGVGGGFGV